jgi:hypothetical protein
MLPKYKLSIIDELFFGIFGFYPTKEGQSYEMLVGSVLKILNPEKKIVWDERKVGVYDNNSYQIDVSLYEVDSESIMVEAKDHTKYGLKVSRPELDKVAGTLIEINSTSGYVFSATDFTRDANQKSIGSKINPNAKDISLYHLRPSTLEDRKGRINKFQINISVFSINPEKVILNPTIPDNIIEDFQNRNLPLNFTARTDFDYQNKYVSCLAELFDDSGVKVGYFKFYKSIDIPLLEQAKERDFVIQGRWKVDSGNINLYGAESPIEYINYRLPFDCHTEPLVIESTGNPILLVKNQDNSVNTLITDYQMKGITFNKGCEIEFDGRHK